MFDLTHNLLQRQIAELDPTSRIIVVHPGYLAQRRVLQQFWNTSPCIYLRVEIDSATQIQLQSSLINLLDGLTLEAALDQCKLLIVDESDKVIEKELEAFLTNILSKTHGRVLLFTRQLPYFVINNGSLGRITHIIPQDPNLLLPNYNAISHGKSLLEVHTLGYGRVLLNGKVIDNWDGDLPRQLFFYLIDRGMTTRAQIFDTFWPTLSTREATNVFHVTKRKISEVLGVDLTQYSSGFYRVSPDIELSYDVALFHDMLQQSAVAPLKESRDLLERAIWLYRGSFLGQIDANSYPWIQERRQHLMQSYGDALIGLAKLVEQSGDTERALGLYIRALATNRQREDLAGTIMGLYRDFGRYDDALKTYDVLAAEIMNTLGISPAQWLQDMAENIRNQEISTLQPVRR
ncbi:MAG: bacterial transcriptional activator domain-containing protein [Anaerolineae bacterium]